MANITPEQWAATLLQRLGIHQTPGAVQSLVGWERAEGGNWNNSARYNPLNTTMPAPGAGNTGSQGNIKVYTSWDQGLDATTRTLRNGLYGPILSALKTGDPNQIASAIGSSKWGTNANLVRRTILSGHAKMAQPVQGLGGSQPSPSTSGSGSSGQPAQPGFQDPGQAGDFTSLLSSLLSKPQQPMAGSVAVAPPSFTATPPVPQGFQAAPSQAPVQPGSQATLQDALGLLGSLGGSSGTTPAPGPSSGSDATGGASDAPSTPAGGKHGSEVLELIHNDGAGKAGFGIKNGEAVNGSQVFSGVWDGHANHVHVAAGRKTVVALGQLAQHMGLTVSENPHFGGVTQGAHVPDSYHYKGEAIDASGSPQQMDAFARAVERYNQTRVLPR